MSTLTISPEYEALLRKVPPKVIRTEKENEAYTEILYELDKRSAKLTAAEKELAELLTLLVEDLNSGVKDVTLSGSVQYVCQQGSQVEDKKFPLETQETKPTPDQENKVPVSASLVYAVEFGKMGCKENWMFGGGKLSLVGKAHNFVGGAELRTLHVNLKKQLSP